MTLQSFVAWEGASPITGDPIVLIVTGRSANEKTGPMRQTWLLLRDIGPFDAVKQGRDAAICGGCVHRGGTAGRGRTCYVSLFTGPLQIWRTFQAGRYPVLALDRGAAELAGEHVRVTAYGDPALLPFGVWTALLARTAGIVGYTHQWRSCDPRFARFCMASVDSPAEQALARSLGWRTFRVRHPHEPVDTEREFICPASDEAGHRTTCQRCRLCRGTSSPAKSVAILAHGGRISGGTKPASYRDAYEHLDRGDPVEFVCTGRGASRIRLAIQMRYRRRHEVRAVHQEVIGPELVRFWVDAPEVGA